MLAKDQLKTFLNKSGLDFEEIIDSIYQTYSDSDADENELFDAAFYEYQMRNQYNLWD